MPALLDDPAPTVDRFSQPPARGPVALIEPVDDATRRQFLAGLLATGVLIGCGDDGDDRPAPGAAPGFPRSIRHAGGTTTFQAPPSRIVSLDTAAMTDAVLALGVKPIAATTYTPDPDRGAFPPALDGLVDGIESVGGNGEPDLEEIARLNADLLFGYGFSFPDADADAARRLAPVIIAADDATWRQVLDLAATALGREKERDEVLERIDQAVGRLRAVADGRRVQVVRPRGDGTTLVGVAADGPGAMLASAGVVLHPLPGGEEWSPGVVSISDERLGVLSRAEDLVVITSDVEPQARDRLYANNPLWSRLAAVRAGRVHPVQGTAWTNYGPLALLRVLEEATRALAR